MSIEVVLTGVGVLSPIGVDVDSFWAAVCEGRSGVAFLNLDTDDSLKPMGSEVPDFRPKDFVKPRKNIKVMSRDIQLALVAAIHASTDAGLVTEGDARNVPAERMGVIFGTDLISTEVDLTLDAYRAGIEVGRFDFAKWGEAAMDNIFPLWMLKFLPNMPACHIAIAHDAHGPSNSLTLCRCSSLASIQEAARIIQRGDADVMIAGGCGNRVSQDFQTRVKSYYLAPRCDDPSSVPRPFDADRNGTVLGEGAGAFILERREFAESRGAKIYAAVRGFAAANEPTLHQSRPTGRAIRSAIRGALKNAELRPSDIGHVNADGIASDHDDRIEAEAIRAELGDVPVTTQKGNFGDLGSGTGAIESIAALLAVCNGLIPPVRNHRTTAADCPINVVHGKPLETASPFVLKLNQSRMGRSFAMIIER